MECCTGQTECNHIVTIGYLKNFIGDNIKDASGTVVHVTTSQLDTYCPTYSELTGGSLIPNFVDGGSNNWGSSVDGITINGSYSPNQVVNQQDLILTYVRFKSLSISAGKTTFSECGDSTSMSYVYKLTKTIKAMNNCVASESSSEGNDTSNSGNNKITFSSSESWLGVNGTSLSANKNGSWSAPSRSGVISAKVTYKGTTHSASNTVTITQQALTGSYSVFEGTHYYRVDIDSYDGPTFDTCEAVDFSCSATGYYYNRYKWKDSCGEIYNYNYDDRYGSEYGGSDSGHFDKVLCPTDSEVNEKTLTIYYHGYSDSLTFTQNCSQTCEECNDYTTYGSGSTEATVGNCGGDVTLYAEVSATIHHRGWEEGVCNETGTTPTSYPQSIVVSIPENTTQEPIPHEGSGRTEEGGVIYYTITQDAGPCGGCTGEIITTRWNDTSVNVESCDTNATVTINGTVTKEYDNCSPETIQTSTTQVYTFEINTTSSEKTITKTYEDATITIYQAAGPCSGACTCDKITITGVGIGENGGINIVVGNYNQDTCLSNLTASSNQTWLTNLSLSNGEIRGNVTQNTESSIREAIVTVKGYAEDEGDCTKTYTVPQNGASCTCTNNSITSYTLSWTSGETNNKLAFDYPSCCTPTVTLTDTTNFSYDVSTSGKVYVKPNSVNSTPNERNVTINLSINCNGTTCNGSTSGKQSGSECEPTSCTCYLVSEATASTVPASATSATVTWSYSAITWTTASTCTVSSSKTEGTSSKIVTIASATCTDYTKTDTFSWEGHKSCTTNGCNASDVEVTWRVNQTRPDGCDCKCDDFDISGETSQFENIAQPNATLANITKTGSCITIDSVTTTADWISGLSVSGNYIKGNIAAQAYGSSARTATIKVSYKANTSGCTDKTFTITQKGKPCDCGAVTASWGSSTIPSTGGTVTIAHVTTQCGEVRPLRFVQSASNCNVPDSMVLNSGSTQTAVGEYDVWFTFAPNTTTSAYTCAYGYYLYYNNVRACSAYTSFNIEAGEDQCTCSALSVSSDSVALIAGSSTTVTYTANCTNVTSIVSNNTAIATVATGSSVITITGVRSGSTTVTITYTAGGTTCTKTIPVKVNCPTITINPNNISGDCSGGTVPFTAS